MPKEENISQESPPLCRQINHSSGHRVQIHIVLGVFYCKPHMEGLAAHTRLRVRAEIQYIA